MISGTGRFMITRVAVSMKSTLQIFEQNGKDLEALTVGATLFVTRAWAAAHYDANAYLVEAILRTRPEILERVAPR